MGTDPLRAATVGGTADEVEARFYEALQKGDVNGLMACWADEDEIVCVHPNGPRLVGAATIRAAFEAMVSGGSLRIRIEGVRRVEALGASVHTVVERIELLLPDGTREACVIATNVYHRTAQGWRMVAHHASHGTAAESATAGAESAQTLH